jgi:hypothetical protein
MTPFLLGKRYVIQMIMGEVVLDQIKPKLYPTEDSPNSGKFSAPSLQCFESDPFGVRRREIDSPSSPQGLAFPFRSAEPFGSALAHEPSKGTPLLK